MVGPGKAIDTSRWFVICVNSLGSDKGSTCPASIDPATGEPYRLDFPELALEDVANAAHAVVGEPRHRAAGLPDRLLDGRHERAGLHAAAPGQRARAHQRRHRAAGAAIRHRDPLAAARGDPARSASGTTATTTSMRTSPAARYPDMGMSIARKLGVITYRSAMEWNGRFARIRLDPDQREDEPFGRRIPGRVLPAKATPSASCATSTRTATCTCRAPATGSTSPNTATAACSRGSSASASSAPW